MIGLENQFSAFLRVAVLHRFYCIVAWRMTTARQATQKWEQGNLRCRHRSELRCLRQSKIKLNVPKTNKAIPIYKCSYINRCWVLLALLSDEQGWAIGENLPIMRESRMGNLKVNCQVVETLSRRKVHHCSVQETRY